jgi:hypothetical protein
VCLGCDLRALADRPQQVVAAQRADLRVELKIVPIEIGRVLRHVSRRSAARSAYLCPLRRVASIIAGSRMRRRSVNKSLLVVYQM